MERDEEILTNNIPFNQHATANLSFRLQKICATYTKKKRIHEGTCDQRGKAPLWGCVNEGCIKGWKFIYFHQFINNKYLHNNLMSCSTNLLHHISL